MSYGVKICRLTPSSLSHVLQITIVLSQTSTSVNMFVSVVYMAWLYLSSTSSPSSPSSVIFFFLADLNQFSRHDNAGLVMSM